MTLRLVTAPQVEPVTVAEVKLDARIDGFELDDTISLLITAARRQAEAETGRALITQTWELVRDTFPDDEIKVGMLPIQSITSVKYYDTDDVLQTADAASYAFDSDKLPGWIYLNEDYDWPSDSRDGTNDVVIRFVAGYGDAAEDVPAEIRYWIRMQASAAIQAQSAQTDTSVSTQFTAGLLDPYRIKRA